MEKRIPGKYAGMVKVGPKGQIVIPKDARDMMGIAPGDTLLLLCDEKQGVAIPNPALAGAICDDIFGKLGGKGRE